MKTENNRQYFCDNGKIFVRKADGFVMGNGLDLGEDDVIDNYEEIDDPDAKPEISPIEMIKKRRKMPFKKQSLQLTP